MAKKNTETPETAEQENTETPETAHTIRMRCTGAAVSWQGNTYDADDDGCVEVPADALADLMSVGCEPA